MSMSCKRGDHYGIIGSTRRAGTRTWSHRRFGAKGGRTHLSSAQSGRPVKSEFRACEPPRVIQRTEWHPRSSKFGRSRSIRANSVKERNVIPSRHTLETAVNEERKVGKRGWNGICCRGLNFGGFGLLGYDVDVPSVSVERICSITSIDLRFGIFPAKTAGKSAKMLVVAWGWYSARRTSCTYSRRCCPESRVATSRWRDEPAES